MAVADTVPAPSSAKLIDDSLILGGAFGVEETVIEAPMTGEVAILAEDEHPGTYGPADPVSLVRLSVKSTRRSATLSVAELETAAIASVYTSGGRLILAEAIGESAVAHTLRLPADAAPGSYVVRVTDGASAILWSGVWSVW